MQSRFVFALGAAALTVSCASRPDSSDAPSDSRSPAAASCLQQMSQRDRRDPYTLDAHMPGQPSGPCLDPSKKRPIRPLNGENANQAQFIFANFFHAGKFWRARVAPDQVERVSFVLEHFPAVVPAAHSMLRFDMKAGHELELVPQAPNPPGPTLKIRSFLYSVEATGDKNFSFDLAEGLLNKFAIVYRFVSLDEIYDEAILQQNHLVQQFALRASPEDRAKVLRYALNASIKNGDHLYSKDPTAPKDFYNTIFRNCTTEPYAALDHSIEYGAMDDVLTFLTQHRKPLPTLAVGALKTRGIFDREIAPLNQEMDPSWTPARLNAKPHSADSDSSESE